MPVQHQKRVSTIGRGDYQYLTQPRGNGSTWYVTVAVPRALRGSFGGRKSLVRSLKTADVGVARAARWSALADLKAEIEKVRRSHAGDDPTRAEAMEWREYLSTVTNPTERQVALDRIIDRTEQLQYRSPDDHHDDVDAPLTESEPTSAVARSFFDLATGKATPIDTYLDRWLAATTYTERTKADARTAVSALIEWCDGQRRPAFIERIDNRVASDFRDTALVGKVHPKTANKKLSALRQYWAWLDDSFGIAPNPWAGKSLPKPKAHQTDPHSADGAERPFNDDELAKLLAGDCDQELRDMMTIAALSGMRIDEIGQLRVGDCRDNEFNIRTGKTAAAVRKVPIHSLLRPIVRRLSAGRPPLEFLFADLKDTGWDGNRTMAVSKRFTTYRRGLGVDDVRQGARRSKVNFHSFRRWFATKCEEAGQPENVVAAVMGHKKDGMTFGLYSQAKLIDLKRRCVERVKLPGKQKDS